MNDNTKIATGNDELLTWAVENITAWNDDYTHLRSDDSHNPVFYTSGSGWIIQPGEFWFGESLCDNHEELEVEDFSTKTPQVITKQEWQDAKLRNAFNTVLEMRHSSSKADNTAQDSSTTSCKPLQGLNEVQVGHIHAELMAEYAEVAKTNPEPWKEFEYLCGYYKDGEEIDVWEPCLADLCFRVEVEYRRKPSPPKTMNIGGIVVEAWPLQKAEIGDRYFEAMHHFGEFIAIAQTPWTAAKGTFLDRSLKAGYIFSTMEQAQSVADALNKVYNDALVGWKQQ